MTGRGGRCRYTRMYNELSTGHCVQYTIPGYSSICVAAVAGKADGGSHWPAAHPDGCIGQARVSLGEGRRKDGSGRGGAIRYMTHPYCTVSGVYHGVLPRIVSYPPLTSAVRRPRTCSCRGSFQHRPVVAQAHIPADFFPQNRLPQEPLVPFAPA